MQTAHLPEDNAIPSAGRRQAPEARPRPMPSSASPVEVPAQADAALLARAAQGDEGAAGALYHRFGAMLYAVAFRITRERVDAEEAVLETFAQAWRDAAKFAAERGSVAAWLTMIARSRALDLVRARTRRERATAAAGQEAATLDTAPAMGSRGEDPFEAVLRDDRASRVRHALGVLSPPQRQAIDLAFYEGLSQSEIAARLGEPLGTIKTRIRLGMQKLREALTPFLPETDA